MCLKTLHDKARALGLGLRYEKHWASDFRDLFDNRSPQWAATSLQEKLIDLNAFEAAGVPVSELVENYRETLGARPGADRALQSLPTTLSAYHRVGHLRRPGLGVGTVAGDAGDFAEPDDAYPGQPGLAR